VRFAFDLGIEQNFLEEVVPVVANLYHDDFPEVAKARDNVIAVLSKEEKAFRQTIRKGLKEFEKVIDDGLTGEEIFTLYDTYGFPVELSVEEAYTRDIAVSENWRHEFDGLMAEQRAKSQTAAKGTFKGGLGGQSWQHRRYHTATHLLQSALREIFGPELRQHGSNITEERLRFDFNLDRKMTPEEIARAEGLVNKWIADDLPIWWQEYPTEEALKMGAIGPFGERYGAKVKVYQMGRENSGFSTDKKLASLEICGGPHCEHTGQLAEMGDPDDSIDAPENTPIDRKTDFSKIKPMPTFKIVKEEASSAGIRRIKAVIK
jgi:alanyl-tRNA synthetase